MSTLTRQPCGSRAVPKLPGWRSEAGPDDVAGHLAVTQRHGLVVVLVGCLLRHFYPTKRWMGPLRRVAGYGNYAQRDSPYPDVTDSNAEVRDAGRKI